MDYTQIETPLNQGTLSRITNSSIDRLLEGESISSSELINAMGGALITPESLSDGVITSKITVGGGTNALTITYGSDILLEEGGDIKFTSVTAPGALTGALAGAGAGNVDDGTHTYKVTFTNDKGETTLGTVSNTVTVVDKASDGQVSLTAIPLSTDKSVTSRKIYRTKAGGGTYFLLTTLSDNVTTIYTDNTADAGLGASAGTARDNTTVGRIYLDSNPTFLATYNNTFVGRDAGTSLTVGINNVLIGAEAGYSLTTAVANTLVGYQAGWHLTTGSYNVLVGYYAGGTEDLGGGNVCVGYYAGKSMNNDTGDNTLIGHEAGEGVTTGNQNVCLGYRAGEVLAGGTANVLLGYTAGQAETGSNKLYIENTNSATPLIYGEFDTNFIKINGELRVTGDIGGEASSNSLTGATDTPTAGYNWDGTGAAPDGYIKAYVGTQAVVMPYWNT